MGPPTEVHHNVVRGNHTALQRTKTQEYALTRLEHTTCPSQPFLVSTAYKTPLHTITWIQQHGIHLQDQTSQMPSILSWQDFIRITLHTLPMVFTSFTLWLAKFSSFHETLYVVCSPLDLHCVWCNPIVVFPKQPPHQHLLNTTPTPWAFANSSYAW